MFGIGGLGKLVGGVLDKVGLGKIAPFVSIGINALSGNWVGAAADVAQLANRLTGGKIGFLNTIAKFAPIASAFAGGGGKIGDMFKGGGIGSFVDKFKGLAGNLKGAQSGLQLFKAGDALGGATKIFKAFEEVKSFVEDGKRLAAQLRETRQQLGV